MVEMMVGLLTLVLSLERVMGRVTGMVSVMMVVGVGRVFVVPVIVRMVRGVFALVPDRGRPNIPSTGFGRRDSDAARCNAVLHDAFGM